MRVGRSHKWYYDKGEWKESKVTPDLWQTSYAVTKRRAGRAPKAANGARRPPRSADAWSNSCTTSSWIPQRVLRVASVAQRKRKRRPARRARRAGGKRWSQRVTQESNALDLEPSVFAKRDPRAIARSLKRSAERSRRRKSGAYRSAMSMLTFFINRAGRQLSADRRRRLERAKGELRDLYGKGNRKPRGKRRGG